MLHRITLPKAREQHASSASNSPGQGMQLPTAMPGTLPGTRVVSAEQRAPDQGGLFKDTGLVHNKDTGGVGTADPHPPLPSLLHHVHRPDCTHHFPSCTRTLPTHAAL